MLNQEQIQNIRENQTVMISTADTNGQPRSIVVIPSEISNNEMVISIIQSEKSFENLNQNPKCFINVYLVDSETQYKIEGIAEIFDDGDRFEQIKKYEESENLPADLTVKAIAVIKFVTVEVSVG